MPLLNSNKPYQFHIEARPTNSYAYFYEPIRTCPFFYQESSWSAILLFLSEDSLVVLRSCPYLCGGTDLPQQLGKINFCKNIQKISKDSKDFKFLKNTNFEAKNPYLTHILLCTLNQTKIV